MSQEHSTENREGGRRDHSRKRVQKDGARKSLEWRLVQGSCGKEEQQRKIGLERQVG